ncbi:MAG: hypothetical protein ACE147_15810 [Candidatus Methylomirabilales bacterium]
MKSLATLFGVAMVLALVLTAVGLVGSGNRAAAQIDRPDKEEVRGLPGRAADSCVGASVAPAGPSRAC